MCPNAKRFKPKLQNKQNGRKEHTLENDET